MPPSPPASGQDMIAVIPSEGWYVHFYDAAPDEHNDHTIVAWGLSTDKRTLIPFIVSSVNSESVVQLDPSARNYVLLHPYSVCPACVRPEVTGG